jgi:hypothetical protein
MKIPSRFYGKGFFLYNGQGFFYFNPSSPQPTRNINIYNELREGDPFFSDYGF